MNKNEKVGNMRERITIQVVAETQSGTGYPAENWTTYATRWAAVSAKPTANKEMEEAGQKTATQGVMFTLRDDANVTPKHRILYRNNYYDIVSVTPDALRMHMEIETDFRK